MMPTDASADPFYNVHLTLTGCSKPFVNPCPRVLLVPWSAPRTVRSSASHNYLYGDAVSMTDHTIGGNDTLTGGSSASGGNFLWGDAKQLIGPVHGGDDNLTGGDYASSNYLYGDGDLLDGSYVGAVPGNDTLRGGDHTNAWASGANYLYGDGAIAQANAICGNDRLVSGLDSKIICGVTAIPLVSTRVQCGVQTRL
jgi:hypothetical protein